MRHIHIHVHFILISISYAYAYPYEYTGLKSKAVVDDTPQKMQDTPQNKGVGMHDTPEYKAAAAKANS